MGDCAKPSSSHHLGALNRPHWFDWFDSVRDCDLNGSIAGSRVVRLLVRGWFAASRLLDRGPAAPPPLRVVNRTSANQREPVREPVQTPCAATIEPIEPVNCFPRVRGLVRLVRFRPGQGSAGGGAAGLPPPPVLAVHCHRSSPPPPYFRTIPQSPWIGVRNSLSFVFCADWGPLEMTRRNSPGWLHVVATCAS
jgi:hypothetical protein